MPFCQKESSNEDHDVDPVTGEKTACTYYKIPHMDNMLQQIGGLNAVFDSLCAMKY
jgi:hypothetical protein